MADKKRTWTNADLQSRRPLSAEESTTYGPWTTPGEAMGGIRQAADSVNVDALLDAARATLARTDPLRPTRANAAAQDADRRLSGARTAHASAVQHETDVNNRSFADKALSTADTTAMGGAFVPGVNMVAGPYLAMRGISDAVQDPTAMNIGMAALGVPGISGAVRGVRNLVRGAQEAKAIRGVRDTYGAGDMGAAFSREVPYRAGGGTSAGPAVSPSGGAETMLQRARGQVDDFLGGLRGDAPSGSTRPTPGRPSPPPAAEPPSLQSMGSMIDESPLQNAADRTFQSQVVARGSRLTPSAGRAVKVAETDPALDALDDIERVTGGAGIRSVAGRGTLPAEPGVSRIPMGAGSRLSLRDMDKTDLTPDELAEVPGFWDDIIEQYFGRNR